MKISPLFMKGPLVVAAIDGVKTQTRRTDGLQSTATDHGVRA